MDKLLYQIEYYQDKLEILGWPILHPKMYYLNFADYQSEGERDINTYKNYENIYKDKVDLLVRMLKERNIEDHRTLNITINYCIPYIDIEKIRTIMFHSSISNT